MVTLGAAYSPTQVASDSTPRGKHQVIITELDIPLRWSWEIRKCIISCICLASLSYSLSVSFIHQLQVKQTRLNSQLIPADIVTISIIIYYNQHLCPRVCHSLCFLACSAKCTGFIHPSNIHPSPCLRSAPNYTLIKWVGSSLGLKKKSSFFIFLHFKITALNAIMCYIQENNSFYP